MDIERINYLLEHPAHLDSFIITELGIHQPVHLEYITKHELKEMLSTMSSILRLPEPQDEVIDQILTDITITQEGMIDRQELNTLLNMYLHIIKAI